MSECEIERTCELKNGKVKSMITLSSTMEAGARDDNDNDVTGQQTSSKT